MSVSGTEEKKKNPKYYIGEFDTRPNSNHRGLVAEITYKDRNFVMHNQYTAKYERYTLLEEQTTQEVSIDDIMFDDLDDELFGDLLDDDSVDIEEKDDELANAMWKKKYAGQAASKEDDDLNDEDLFDQDTDQKEDNVGSIQDGNITILNPPTEEQLAKSYYVDNKKVLFDFYRYVPYVGDEKIPDLDDDGNMKYNSKGETIMKANPLKRIQKDVYGDEELYDEVSLVVNRVMNFNKTPSNYVNNLVVTEDNDMVQKMYYAEDDVKFVSITTITGIQKGYEYEDTKTGTKVKIKVLPNKKGSAEIGAKHIDLPYDSRRLESTKVNELKLFRMNSYNRTVVFPDPNVFRRGLDLGYMDGDIEYEVVDTENKLIDYVDRILMPCEEVIAYDAETFGLKTFRWYSKRDLVCTHSFSWDDGKSIIIPIRMKYCKNIKPEVANEILRPVFETKPILAHNGAADVRFNMPDGIVINLVEDTIHLIRVIIPFMVKVSATKTSKGVLKRAIDDLIKRMFGWDMIDLHKLVFEPAGVDFDFSILPYNYLIWYGCPDTDLLRRLWKILRYKLNPEQEHSYRQLVAYSKAMAILASYSGIGVDVNKMKKTRDKAQECINQIKQLIYATTGETERTLPLSSSGKISNYVFGKLQVPASKGKPTPKGGLSADKHVMKALAEESNPNPTNLFKKDIKDEEGKVVLSAEDLNRSKYPFCMMHRKYADLNKDVTAFYNRIINSTLEGVYYEFYQPGKTDTYRDTGAIQITKKPVKYFLGAYNNHYGFCSMDYNTEEFRIAVNRSSDINLIKMLRDPESDAHTMVAANMYHCEPSEIDKKRRDPIKTCNFGILYGMGVKRLTKNLKKTEHPTDEEVAEIQVVYDDYTYTYAEMLAPLTVARDHVRQYGWVENDLGYRMIYSQVIDVEDFIEQVFDADNLAPPVVHLDPIKRSQHMEEIMNRAGNYPIQSLAAAQLKDAVIRLFDKIVEAGLLDYVFVPLSVHDEIGVIYDKRKVDPYWLFAKIHECFYSEMEYLNKPKDQICPLYIGIGFGTSWGNAKSDPVEFPVAFQSLVLEEFYSNTHPKLTEKDDHMKHFADRIQEYMKSRVSEIFKEMVEQKEFRRNEMRYRVNESVFLGKKMDELFHTNDKVKDPVTGEEKLVPNMDRYIDIILEHLQLDKDDFNIIDGPEIKKEKKKEEEDIIEFRYNKQPHPLVKEEGTYLTVDVRNVFKPTLKPLSDYLRSLHNPNRNYHNKTVRFLVSNNLDYVPLNGVQILGVPIDFKEKIDNILKTGTVDAAPSKVKLPSPPILYDTTNHYIIFDLNIIRGVGQGMVDDISRIISKYSTTEKVNPYRVLFYVGDKYQYTDIFMNGIPIQLPEEVKQVAFKYNRTY